MKTIEKDELFSNLQTFLKSRGVELQDGSYAQRVRQGCGLLTDVINTAQETVSRAKAEADRKLGQLRQLIHERTAPRSQPPPSPVAGEAEGRPASAKARPTSGVRQPPTRRPQKKKSPSRTRRTKASK
jgi:hypothetical protein